MTDNKGYKHAGDVDIRSFKLVSAGGQIIDIENITVDFSVYQSIFDHYLQCDLVINDSLGLFNDLNPTKGTDIQGGFSGGDLLIVSYRSNDDSLPYKNHIFVLHGMTDRTRLEENSEAYFLSGVSLEAYSSASQKISKAYGGDAGNAISAMVESITNEYINTNSIQSLYQTLKSKIAFTMSKKNTFDETVGSHKFVIPNLTIDDTIDFLCKEADSDDHIPYYLFYENSDGYNFRNLSNLVSQEPKETYTYYPSNINNMFLDRKKVEYDEATNLITFHVMKQGDFLENIHSGMFRSKTINLDLTAKSKSEQDFKYDNYVGKFKKLQNYKIASGELLGDPVVRLLTSKDQKKYNQTAAQSESYYSHIFNTHVEASLPGDSELNAGDVIYLSVPPSTNVRDQVGTEDKYLSGKYLITKLRNKMLDGSKIMTTIVECVKDTATKQ